jgi:hypothetical protein
VARPHPNPRAEERELTKAAPGEAKSLRIHAAGDEARPQPEVRARSRGGKAVIRVRQRRNNTRAGPHFAVCLTLPGGQERELTGAAPGESNQIKPRGYSIHSTDHGIEDETHKFTRYSAARPAESATNSGRWNQLDTHVV